MAASKRLLGQHWWFQDFSLNSPQDGNDLHSKSIFLTQHDLMASSQFEKGFSVFFDFRALRINQIPLRPEQCSLNEFSW